MLKDIAPKAATGGVDRARRLRRAMTLPEVLLWNALRARPAGLKFRRQHPCGSYILDFYCSDARLAIEVDGEVHSRGDQPMRDTARDRWCAKAGIAVLRIPAAAVLGDMEAVVRGVVAAALAQLPLHHASHGPPPRAKLGED
ncbi:endonuclease domain-containing protein [Sphingomonas sp. S1-29]|uniref:endonuclease domain-containing protein n=1 Tax=Sphingomonas sp. S1-29 TaxID=2991074 RepID=UPI00224065B3|nr:endonuclease domain-containing protein [Sphingomonas sp. S1-29]UZK70706.1 endonuclease domain-containing protein [Sphingomonas sp. S1-29]